MVNQLKLEYGDEISVFNEQEQIDEWHKRIKDVAEELTKIPKEKRFIGFLMKRAYSHSYSSNTKLLYKQTFLGWRHTPIGDLPKYKPHYIYFRLGRAKLRDSEQIAYMDMKRGFMREADRPLTEFEKLQKEKQELEKKVRDLEKEKNSEEAAKEWDNLKAEIEEKEKDEKEVKSASTTGKAKGKKASTKTV